MLHKLENTRLQSSNSKVGRVLAACVVSTGILAATVLSVNGAPQFTGAGQLPSYDQGTEGLSGLADFQPVGWGGRSGRGRLLDLSDSEIEERLSRIVRHAAIEIDASQEQIDKIVGILTPAAIEMKNLRKDIAGTGEELRKLLLSAEVDRFSVEALRAEKLALADEVSKKLTDVIIEVAMVLTPEQRAVLDTRIKQFKSMRPGFKRH
ncbi:MAG: hypothetical protein K5905_20435 [Roseibium sp.]|uniref:Spy/CpxP family protein refolding chaperone n=1 Tax=Roseibium sp. TaxID=1936156 RepID=UPI00262A6EB3|nr:hypothetical protein [Roseibium sp.]MCV0427832.1 hypothetical protein [Roseibium sp.]